MGDPRHIDPAASRVLLPELSSIPGHLFWRAHARVLLTLGDELPDGVDAHAYAAMLALAAEPLSQQAVADLVSTSRTTIAKVAADLAERGLVERVRNPDDRRAYLLSPTAEGTRAMRTWRRHVDALESSLAEPFAERQWSELQRLLLRVAEPGLDPRTPEPLRRSVGFLVVRVHQWLHRDVGAAVAPLGVEPRHIGSLVALGALGPVPQHELARALGISGASVVQIVDHLEAAGLVERRRMPDDRRSQVLHRLPGSAQVLTRARSLGSGATDGWLGVLTDTQRARLLSLLARLVTG